MSGRTGLAAQRLEFEHVAIELRAFLGVGRADGEFVDVAVLGPAAAGDLGIDFLARVVFLLREIEDIAVGIVAAVGGEGARGGPLHDRRVPVLALHALQHGLDVVDEHAEMIDAPDVPVASRNEVQADVAVADGDRRGRAALAGSLQPEHGLVEFAERVVLVADDGYMIDLGEHAEGIYHLTRSP